MTRLRYLAAIWIIVCAMVPAAAQAARQTDRATPLPGVTVDTLGSASAGLGAAQVELWRVNLEPGASIPPHANPEAAVAYLERGSVGVEVALGAAQVTPATNVGVVRILPGDEVMLAPGDTVSYAGHTELTLRNRANGTSTLLFAALPRSDQPLFGAAPTGSFSVETYACPAGMTRAEFEPGACQRSASPLVTWSLASDHFTAPLDPDMATIEGAKTTWNGLPVAVYFVELTAEAFAPGYADYYIPGSDQVTRHGERTTRIYYDAVHARGSFKAYVFTKRLPPAA